MRRHLTFASAVLLLLAFSNPAARAQPSPDKVTIGTITLSLAGDEIEWANKAALKVLGLQQSDKGQRIPNLIRYPDFIRYLESRDYYRFYSFTVAD